MWRVSRQRRKLKSQNLPSERVVLEKPNGTAQVQKKLKIHKTWARSSGCLFWTLFIGHANRLACPVWKHGFAVYLSFHFVVPGHLTRRDGDLVWMNSHAENNRCKWIFKELENCGIAALTPFASANSTVNSFSSPCWYRSIWKRAAQKQQPP